MQIISGLNFDLDEILPKANQKNLLSSVLCEICGLSVHRRSIGLIDPPQREWPTSFEVRIDAIDEIQAAVVTRADERFLFTEGQGIERASKFSKHDLDDDEIFVALFINGENFGYDGSHMRQFLCSTKTKNKNQRGRPLSKTPGPRTSLRLVCLVGERNNASQFRSDGQIPTAGPTL
jgi:hypothetical protein